MDHPLLPLQRLYPPQVTVVLLRQRLRFVRVCDFRGMAVAQRGRALMFRTPRKRSQGGFTSSSEKQYDTIASPSLPINPQRIFPPKTRPRVRTFFGEKLYFGGVKNFNGEMICICLGHIKIHGRCNFISERCNLSFFPFHFQAENGRNIYNLFKNMFQSPGKKFSVSVSEKWRGILFGRPKSDHS